MVWKARTHSYLGVSGHTVCSSSTAHAATGAHSLTEVGVLTHCNRPHVYGPLHEGHLDSGLQFAQFHAVIRHLTAS